ncbi:MAG: hypothetical protein HY300_18080 [Verrucomicrobia bacterium]|nr:hypothetical protein [Verrucomicrobiota bacterium]
MKRPENLLKSAMFNGLVVVSIMATCAFAQAPKAGTRLVVAADGSGDFRTVQAAVDAVPANHESVTTIFIRAGEYDGIIRVGPGKNRIRFLGEDRKRTILSGVNNEKLHAGTAQRALLTVAADDFTLENLTVRNRTPYKGSQAEALSLQGDRCILRDADFLSFQDTLQLSGRAYVTNCFVEGDVDFIWGYGTAFFEKCEIRAVHDGYYLQSRNPAGKPGYVFVNCKLTAAAEVKRNWLARIETERFPDSHVAFIRCAMGAHIPAAGWLVTGTNTGALRFEEFATTDLGGNKLDASQRHAASKQLTATEAAALADAAEFLTGRDGWNPKAPVKDARVFDVRQLGAKGDGKMLDTAAIQKALDDCGKSGGGIVRLAAGTYLSQPILLRSNTTLQLDAGATLQATDEPADFRRAGSGRFLSFINAERMTNITIAGAGVIDGAGARWWAPAEEARRKQPGYTLPRPRLVTFAGCKDVKVLGVTLRNSPCFHLVPADCEDVTIIGVTITAPAGSPNTDGIDPAACQRVFISHCGIDVGDDNIAIKSGHADAAHPGAACADIRIADCTFLHGHGLSIGSETLGGVRNVDVQRCTFTSTRYGLRIKSPRGRGGVVENIRYSDIAMTNVDSAITITTYYPKVPKEDASQPVTAGTPRFRDIQIRNLTATCPREAGMIVGLPESLVSGVILENVHLTAKSGLTIRNATAVQFRNSTYNGERLEPVSNR